MFQDSIGADRATRNPNETAKTLEAPIYAESVAGDLSCGIMVAATWSGIFYNIYIYYNIYIIYIYNIIYILYSHN